MSKKPPLHDLANWDAGEGGVDSDAKKAKLFSTEARERPENVTGTSDHKQWIGKSGRPKGPFGVQGRSA